ncbi:hypothetical protein MMC12_000992 [Toensbergia leucococca]|nr:hypothetical protein [Toensbergia leucococca]
MEYDHASDDDLEPTATLGQIAEAKPRVKKEVKPEFSSGGKDVKSEPKEPLRKAIKPTKPTKQVKPPTSSKLTKSTKGAEPTKPTKPKDRNKAAEMVIALWEFLMDRGPPALKMSRQAKKKNYARQSSQLNRQNKQKPKNTQSNQGPSPKNKRSRRKRPSPRS